MTLARFALMTLTVMSACVTPRAEEGGYEPLDRPAPTPLSADVLAAGVPVQCCPACSGIRLSVRATSDAPVTIDWTRSRVVMNGADVALVLDAATSKRSDGHLMVEVPAGTTWEATLMPQAGAPNASALREGVFRPGRYRVRLAVHAAGAADTELSPVDVDVPLPAQDGTLAATCPGAAH
jgi:hypothetical protein